MCLFNNKSLLENLNNSPFNKKTIHGVNNALLREVYLLNLAIYLYLKMTTIMIQNQWQTYYCRRSYPKRIVYIWILQLTTHFMCLMKKENTSASTSAKKTTYIDLTLNKQKREDVFSPLLRDVKPLNKENQHWKILECHS